MRVVVQRVSQSNVKVSDDVIGEINEGLMVLVSFVDDDNNTDLEWMTKKIVNLRIFNDDEGGLTLEVEGSAHGTWQTDPGYMTLQDYYHEE